MIKTVIASFLGLIYGAVLSFILSLLFMVLAQVIAGGITSIWGERWLYYATLIPFSITIYSACTVFYKGKERKQ